MQKAKGETDIHGNLEIYSAVIITSNRECGAERGGGSSVGEGDMVSHDRRWSNTGAREMKTVSVCVCRRML